jgi:Right handed beta helix region
MTIAAIASIRMRWRPLVLLVALFSFGGLSCVGPSSGLNGCPGGDRTAALSDQIAAAPDHSTVTLATHGCYEIDGTVTIAGKTDVILDGNGALLQRFGSPARWAPILQLSRDHTIRVHDLRIDGFKPDTIGYVPDREGQHGIVLDGADHVTLDHLTITHVFADGFYITNYTNNVVIRDSTTIQMGRHGMAIVNGQTITYTGNDNESAHRWDIDLEPTTGPVDRITITKNRILHPNIGFICAAGLGDYRCDGRGTNLMIAGNVLEW